MKGNVIWKCVYLGKKSRNLEITRGGGKHPIPDSHALRKPGPYNVSEKYSNSFSVKILYVPYLSLQAVNYSLYGKLTSD